MKLVLATRNLGKVKELTAMLTENQGSSQENRNLIDMQVLSLQDFPDAPEIEEDKETYQENASKKASIIAEYTGYRALADDAGLEVEALGGAPGVHSKRWAGEDITDAVRVQKLLEALEGATNRKARFVAAIAIAEPAIENKSLGQKMATVGNIQVVVGKCEGYITYTPLGDGGFGYDPIFVPNGFEKTFAELGEVIKNRISHRSNALRQAIELL
ncbi:non-canonical purine NTP pyrophosphatase, RdgB/HAM1 family [Candidatus Poribacteria bacterium]|nr:MAG: non-canonical purine NTP pyrophosphatase, RdgB/HAM1 family [Candidatus Poribacteria bacterium]